MIKSFECPKSIRNNEKKIILGTSDSWSMSLLSRHPSKPVCYIIDSHISRLNNLNFHNQTDIMPHCGLINRCSNLQSPFPA